MGSWFSTVEGEVPGFLRKERLEARDLRAGVFVWLAPDAAAFTEQFGSIASKLTGIVVTLGERTSCAPMAESVWCYTVTTGEVSGLQECLGPWVANLEQVRAEQRTAQRLTIELERAAKDRERLEVALRHAERQVHLVLEHTGDALVLVDLSGRCDPEASSLAFQWFGSPKEQSIWDYLLSADPAQHAMMRLGFEALRDDFLPAKVIVDQLPNRVSREGRTYELSPRQIRQGERLQSILFVIRDISEAIARRQAELLAREEQAIITAAIHDRQALGRSMLECGGLLAELRSRPDRLVTKRALHTLKGNAAVLGFHRVPEICHRLEDLLITDPERYDDEGALAELISAWNDVERAVSRLVPDLDETRIELTEEEFLGFIERLRQANVPETMVEMAQSFRLTSTKRIFTTLSKSVERLAHRASKQVVVAIESHGVRISVAYFSGILSGLVHLFRNSVDHGFESPEERLRAGKPENCRLLLKSEVNEALLTLTVADDGRGVDWERVRQKAEGLGLACRTHDDLVEALFSDGFSTAETVTALSGRGVGLSAIKAAVEQVQGTIEVESTPGRGTTFRFRIPVDFGADHGDAPTIAHFPTRCPPGRRLRDSEPVVAKSLK